MSENNQTLVYDISRQAWVGVWEGLPAGATHAATTGDKLLIWTEDGSPYQALVNNCWDDDGDHPGMLFEHVLEIGDQPSSYMAVEVNAEHHHGGMSVYVMGDGVMEDAGSPKILVPSPEKVTSFGGSTYDLSNVDDDQTDPWREDYAVVFPVAEDVAVGWVDDEGTAIVTDTGEEIEFDPANPLEGTGIYHSDHKGLVHGMRQAMNVQVRMRKPARSVVVRCETARGWQAIQRIGVRSGVRLFGRDRRHR